jgi:hypothetical protein
VFDFGRRGPTVMRQLYFKSSVYIYPTNYLLHAIVARR